ncbi:hypothetical protein Rumeso_04337 [Rubellimicrobium mesophilum DSM 19309]|uniref:Uncharacterized protein n=1 Tax=Rubellimicrobium mesophilum DSM 19309 TaxID=442562 RepID=A0A017HK04_9RHOB|nr:hypothetical protein [Rubellimicrobium mesophilum]EYD74084.1 hypothetical protein Rumeso_04337 [Rubellimicrobium mesophilum DSM 19309]
MPVIRSIPTREFDASSWYAVIVGQHMDTATVGKIWIHKNGSMLFGDLLRRPGAGRSPIGEAITAFGLTKVRQFPSTEVFAAKAYAARLRIALEPGDD